MRRLAKLLLPVLLWTAGALAQQPEPGAAPAAAERGKSANTLDALRPSGPVTVKADRAEWVQDSTMKYTGHVTLQSSTLTLHGDSMDVKQLADGNFEALINGAPAVLDHQPQPGTTGPAAQPVHAEAKQLQYISATGTVTLSGDAHLQRGSDEVRGANIGYEVDQRRVRASGDGEGQVTITFTPPPPKQNEPPAKPAPARSPAPPEPHP